MASHENRTTSYEMGAARRKCLTIETKLRLLNELETGVLQKNVARKYRIAQSTLSTIIRNADRLRQNGTQHANRKRIRAAEYGDVEESLHKWLVKKRAQKATVDGYALQAKAKKLAASLNYEHFAASNGWLSRFRLRYGLSTPRKLKVKQEQVAQSTVRVRRTSSGHMSRVDKHSGGGTHRKDASTQAGVGVLLGSGGSLKLGILLCFLDRNCAQTQTVLPLSSRDAATSPAKVKLADKGCGTMSQ